jgi:hypothetical protein
MENMKTGIAIGAAVVAIILCAWNSGLDTSLGKLQVRVSRLEVAGTHVAFDSEEAASRIPHTAHAWTMHRAEGTDIEIYDFADSWGRACTLAVDHDGVMGLSCRAEGAWQTSDPADLVDVCAAVARAEVQ